MTSFWNLAKSKYMQLSELNVNVIRNTYHLNVWGHSGQEVQQLIVVDAVRVSQFFGELVHPWKLKQQWCIRPHSQSAVQEDLIRPCTDSEPSSLYFTGSAAMELTGALLSDLAELQIWTLYERAHGALATSEFVLSSAVYRPPCCAGGESLEHANLNCH